MKSWDVSNSVASCIHSVSGREVAALVFLVRLLKNLWRGSAAEEQDLLWALFWRKALSWRARRNPSLQ